MVLGGEDQFDRQPKFGVSLRGMESFHHHSSVTNPAIYCLLYNFPFLPSSPSFKIAVWLSFCTLSQRPPFPAALPL